MDSDPKMPRQLPAAVERALAGVLAWRARPAPIDFYLAIRDALLEAEQAASGDLRPLDPPESEIGDLREPKSRSG